MTFDDDRRIRQRAGSAADVTVDLTGRPDLREVRAAMVEALLPGAEPDDRFGAVLLVVDELVGNAYRHATTPMLLRIGHTPENVLVEVTDGDPVAGAVRVVAMRYGLRLVGQLSLDWGVRTDSRGKVVWALVPVKVYPAEM
ncbi:ATP-binding protein [Amycolatopsis sp. CA-126428]|uniref:ATP-binding protein n=1 Tax=Amycolatopsis sp. CA-126428 TaxID=2073158 RepID=UPI000CD07259|nr:ATP-binding protein [Amycolatopsis sp. CA-126428]